VAYGRKGITMTKAQYLAALKRLDLSPASQETADALGVTIRACQFYAAGDRPIPRMLELLLFMYELHGIPDRETSPME